MKMPLTKSQKLSHRSVLRALDQDSPPGVASDYLIHLKELLDFNSAPRIRVVLYCRASTYDQVIDGTLDRQIKDMRRRFRKIGVTVVGKLYVDVIAGGNLREWARPGLVNACKYAKRH